MSKKFRGEFNENVTNMYFMMKYKLVRLMLNQIFIPSFIKRTVNELIAVNFSSVYYFTTNSRQPSSLLPQQSHGVLLLRLEPGFLFLSHLLTRLFLNKSVSDKSRISTIDKSSKMFVYKASSILQFHSFDY